MIPPRGARDERGATCYDNRGHAHPGTRRPPVLDSNVHFARTREALRAWAEDPSRMPPVAGTFEAHVFCVPLDPSHEVKERFVTACDAVGIKALCLGLDYEGKGVVSVLQST